MFTETEILIAYADGLDCFETGRAKAPCQSRVIMDMIAAKRPAIGGSRPILDAWLRGQRNASVGT